MMNSNKNGRAPAGPNGSAGFALITAMVLLFLVSAIVTNLIGYAGEEANSSARSRSTVETFYAADSGIQLSLQRLQLPRDLTAFNYNLVNGTLVESRSRNDAGPMPISDAGIGLPPDGYSINLGGGFLSELFLLNVTASAANNGVAELEAKLGSLQPNSGAY